MTDYNKLKIAHDLAITNKIRFHTKMEDGYDMHLLTDSGFATNNLDEFIEKLEELTQPKPKYEVGQKVWIPIGNKPEDIQIERIVHIENYWHYCTDFGSYLESDVYPSKEFLIQAQIDYWTNLKIEAVSASKMCRKCGMQRMLDGKCWNLGCDYIEPQQSTCTEAIRKHHELEDEQEPCQHESDDNLHTIVSLHSIISNAIFKCKKCGEFYR